MDPIKKIRSEGISLKTAFRIMVILMVFVMCFLLYCTSRSVNMYKRLSDTTDSYIELHRNAESLMDASDFLTDKVQCFTVLMDPGDMAAYFDEVHNVRRREIAVKKMSEIASGTPEFEQLKAALDSSNKLMETEITAMRLICDANGFEYGFEEISRAELPEECEKMTAQEKIRYAQNIVHNSEYYEQKMKIRGSMENCIDILIEHTHGTQSELNTKLRRIITITHTVLVIQSAAMIFILWLTSYLGINPIIKGVRQIKENRRLPVTGSYEFRYLADTYNKMFDALQKNIEHLNYDASHDKLTDLYNRAGFDILSENIDLRSTAVLIIDVDRFKEINDTYGHATGDGVLKKIADILKTTFRDEDYICRIGGDEFVVFMLHMNDNMRELVELKVRHINKSLANPSDGLPGISVSVGISFGCNENDLNTAIKHADEALYNMKSAGRNGCSIYSPQ